MPRRKKVWRKSKKRFKRSWDRVVDGLGRRITIYMPPIERECPACYYDKVNRTSSSVSKLSPGDPNYFTVGKCPVCRGKGVLTTSRRRCIDAIVIWNPAGDNMNSLTFGEPGFEGATRVELKTDPCHLDLIKQSVYAVIDGVQCKMSDPPIIRGMGDKHILIAHFFTTDKPKKDSGEYL
jgi:hypothetical protein